MIDVIGVIKVRTWSGCYCIGDTDKIWWYQNEGIPLKQGRQNSKLNHAPWTDEIFRIGKYEKIKFDKIWEYHNGSTPQMRTPKFTLFTSVS